MTSEIDTKVYIKALEAVVQRQSDVRVSARLSERLVAAGQTIRRLERALSRLGRKCAVQHNTLRRQRATDEELIALHNASVGDYEFRESDQKLLCSLLLKLEAGRCW